MVLAINVKFSTSICAVDLRVCAQRIQALNLCLPMTFIIHRAVGSMCACVVRWSQPVWGLPSEARQGLLWCPKEQCKWALELINHFRVWTVWLSHCISNIHHSGMYKLSTFLLKSMFEYWSTCLTERSWISYSLSALLDFVPWPTMCSSSYTSTSEVVISPFFLIAERLIGEVCLLIVLALVLTLHVQVIPRECKSSGRQKNVSSNYGRGLRIVT